MEGDTGPRSSTEAPTLQDAGTSPEVPAGTVAPGTCIGRYVVVQELGRGGMGAVYAAFDSQLARRVAIKVVRPDVETPEARARLLGEAQAMARLTHSNVVAIFDVGPFGDAVFLAMEYIDGATLRERLKARRPWREALATLLAAGRGLAAAHAAGLVHRDFKPDNVLIGRDGRVVVSDFGIARAERAPVDDSGGKALPAESVRAQPQDVLPPSPAVSADSSQSLPAAVSSSLDSNLTETGGLLGTIGFMSPERALDGRDDARSDQFAFCVTLYLALFGRHPFPYTDLRTYVEALCSPARQPPRDSKVPGWVTSAVLRGLALDPAARFPSMQALLDALAQDPSPKQRRTAVVLGVLAICAIAALVVARKGRALERTCQADGDLVTAVWSDVAKDAGRAAFARSGVNGQARLWEATRAALDAYAGRWSASAISACRAATIERTESPVLWRRSRACLQTRSAELGQLARSLGSAENAVVRRGPDLASSLAPIETCTDRDELLSMVDAPGDASAQKRVADLRGVVAEARALITTYHDADARSRLGPVIDEARHIGFAPLLAEALVEAGDAAPPGIEGEATLVEGYTVALTSRRFVTAGRAAELLTDMIGHLLGRHKEGHVWARLGEAVLGDLHSPEADDVRTAILLDETYVYDEESNAKDAIATAQRAVALATHHHSAEELLSERLHVAMGVAESTGGDLAAARHEFETAADIDTTRLGPDHPRVADRLSDLAATEINDARYDLALGHLDRALAIDEATKTEHHQSYEIGLFNRAQALRLSGQYERALRDTEVATALYAEDGAGDGEDMITIATIAADSHRALGHPAEATAAIEHAEHIAAGLPDIRAGALGELRFAHAEILGRSDPRALAMAKKAREDLGAPTTPDEVLRYAIIDAWIAQPAPPDRKR